MKNEMYSLKHAFARAQGPSGRSAVRRGSPHPLGGSRWGGLGGDIS